MAEKLFSLAEPSQPLATVVVVGGGGREHALVEAYSRSEKVGKIIVIPGNDFMLDHPVKPIVTFSQLKTTDATEIVKLCLKEKANNVEVLVDVAQDDAVAAGVADATRAADILTVGPSKEAGQIEWDKAWSRELMEAAGIPQPQYRIFDMTKKEDQVKSRQFFAERFWQKKWFVKAAGLAAGKGAIPVHNQQEGLKAIEEVRKYGDTFLIEEWLEGGESIPGKAERKVIPGEEFSAYAYCDGTLNPETGKPNMQIVGYAQDHKRAFKGDKGPNTGGMGAVTTPDLVNDNVKKQTEEYFERIFKKLHDSNRPYQGILYFGGMIIKRNGEETVYAIECNARWGDPEAQVLVPGITTDFYELNKAVATGRLKDIQLHTDNQTRVAIAVVAKGYPTNASKAQDRRITGLTEAAQLPGITIFGAGMKKDDDGEYVVHGGRVAYAVAEGERLATVMRRARQAARRIKAMDGTRNYLRFRPDIGHNALQKQAQKEEK